MNKVSNTIVAVTTIIFMTVMLVFTGIHWITGESETSARRSVKISVKSAVDGSYPHSLIRRFAENFSGRIDWVSIDARIESALCENIVNGVCIADSRLIEAADSERNVSDECAGEVTDYVQQYSGAVYFIAVPSSAGVYTELLPEYFTKHHEKQLIDRFYEKLDTGVRRIDAYNRLKMLSDSYVYYRSDSKWTSYGAYCVYRNVIQRLGFQPSTYDKYTIDHVTDSYCGDLYSRTQFMRSKPDILDIYTYSDGTEVTDCSVMDADGKTHDRSLYDMSALDSDNMFALYPGIGYAAMKIVTSIGNDRKLLVIGDDYAASFIPFLLQHYSEVAVVYPEHTEGNISNYLDTSDYEQTLFLFGIDSLCGDNILEGLFEESEAD